MREQLIWQIVNAELSPAFEAKLAAEKDAIRQDTIRLVQILCGPRDPVVPFLPDVTQQPDDPVALWGEELAGLLAKLKQGRIDVDAMVRVETNLQNELRATTDPLLKVLMRYGQWWAAPLLPAVLDQMRDPNLFADPDNPAELHAILGYLVMQAGAFPKAYLAHPRVDVNRPVFDDGRTYLECCLNRRVLSDFRASAATDAALLLDRGALPQGPWRSEELNESTPGLSFFKPYLQQWEQDWESFCGGALAPELLSATQLGHFYALGHLREAMDPKRWQGHEGRALALYEQLPHWVKERTPCILERQQLTMRLFPDPLVQRWSIAREDQAAQKAIDMG